MGGKRGWERREGEAEEGRWGGEGSFFPLEGPGLQASWGSCDHSCSRLPGPASKNYVSPSRFMNHRVPAHKRYQPTEYEHAANCATHAVSWLLGGRELRGGRFQVQGEAGSLPLARLNISIPR